jgi:hypothetical protein
MFLALTPVAVLAPTHPALKRPLAAAPAEKVHGQTFLRIKKESELSDPATGSMMLKNILRQ